MFGFSCWKIDICNGQRFKGGGGDVRMSAKGGRGDVARCKYDAIHCMQFHLIIPAPLSQLAFPRLSAPPSLAHWQRWPS